jgi:hypothetical protein
MSEIFFFNFFTMQDDVDKLHVGDINWWMMWIACMSRELH